MSWGGGGGGADRQTDTQAETGTVRQKMCYQQADSRQDQLASGKSSWQTFCYMFLISKLHNGRDNHV